MLFGATDVHPYRSFWLDVADNASVGLGSDFGAVVNASTLPSFEKPAMIRLMPSYGAEETILEGLWCKQLLRALQSPIYRSSLP
jgi:hypothetical protein